MGRYRALTEAEAVEYVRKIPGLFTEGARLVSKEIGDGNLNLVFRIQEEGPSGKSVIIKQALPYARVVGESWPLTLDRARIESEAIRLEDQLCPGSVPKIYHYDQDLALTVMEDLSSYQVLRKGLIERRRYPHFARHIGRFLARTLFLTSDLALDPQEKKRRVAKFINPELCKITEDLVFTDPYYDAPTNSFNPLLRETIQAIWQNDALKLEVAKLKEKFLTQAQALIHGDLHTGSIMVTEEDTRVIDAEFAFYGPMGFDVGAVIANLLLNYAAQEVRIEDAGERERNQQYLLDTIEELWHVFAQEFKALWEKEGKEHFAAVPGYVDDYLLRVLQDAAGFAGCKMIRRVIGLAPVADLETIEDDFQRARAERLALAIGQALILERAKVQEIGDLISRVLSAKAQELVK
ncbi:MAG: S-methyl-5-thioribose kinase [Bacillus thermozeamaize]|uniref:Methylthioribose kinase n=1 Tax=Bacillus thermozeamaize TaxID=230954 RepID=A0A1Y3PE83_9BACI|nr:MAG: S-methyl-5-thioribose kinase [Bacillus thermozeamaize]